MHHPTQILIPDRRIHYIAKYVAGYDTLHTAPAQAQAQAQAMLQPATAPLPLLAGMATILLIPTAYAQPEYRVPAPWAPWIDYLAFDTEASI